MDITENFDTVFLQEYIVILKARIKELEGREKEAFMAGYFSGADDWSDDYDDKRGFAEKRYKEWI